jgi:hypothetical protein
MSIESIMKGVINAGKETGEAFGSALKEGGEAYRRGGADEYRKTMMSKGSSGYQKAAAYGMPGTSVLLMMGASKHERDKGDDLGANILGAGAIVMGSALALSGFNAVRSANVRNFAQGVVDNSKQTMKRIIENAPRQERAAEQVIAPQTVHTPPPPVEHVAEQVASTPQAPPFTPSHEWQHIPDGTAVPPGGEFNMNMETGKNMGRWPSKNPEVLANSINQRRVHDANKANRMTPEEHHAAANSQYDMWSSMGSGYSDIRQSISDHITEQLSKNRHISTASGNESLYMSELHQRGYDTKAIPQMYRSGEGHEESVEIQYSKR